MVDEIEDVMEVWFDGGGGTLEEISKEVDGVGVDAGAFVFGGMENCVANVAREGEGLMRGRWWVARVGVWWDWSSVELVDVGDVVRSDRCDRLGGTS